MTESPITGGKIFVREGVDLDTFVGTLRLDGTISAAALVPGFLTVTPEFLTRQHLGRKVRFQKITADGHAKVYGVIESFQLSSGGYELTLDGGSSGSIMRGSYDDGATVQFL